MEQRTQSRDGAATSREPDARPGRDERLGYQPALDGLRALAVTAVLLYHHGASYAPGGFLGVDAFFVLSGFLITSLLAVEFRRSGHIRVPSFYGRRVRRLFPALLLLLFVVAAYAAFVAAPAARHSIRLDGIATLFYVENWRLVFSHHSYFDAFGAPSPLRHAWSLAIEEQWYIVWPIAFLVMLRVARGRVERLLPVVVGLAIASAAWMFVLYDPSADPSRVYYGTDTRAQALLIGSALGLLMLWRGHVRGVAKQIALEVAGVAALGFGVWLVLTTRDTSSMLYRGGLFAAALAFAVVIAAAVQPSSVVIGRVLAAKPLVWIGLISYGLYLFHWPIFLWLTPTRTGLTGNSLLLVRCGVTLALAVASYFLVEMPLRRGAFGFPRLRVAAPVVAALAIVAIVATTTSTTAGGDRAAALARQSRRSQSLAASGPTRPKEVKVFLAGDSQAFRLGYTLHHLIFGIYQDSRTILGCGIAGGKSVVYDHTEAASDKCPSWPELYRQGAEGMRPDVSMLFVGAWEVFDRQFNDHRLDVYSDDYRSYLLEQLDVARTALTPYGEPFVILGPACYDRPELTEHDGARIQNDPKRLAWVNGVFRDYATTHSDTTTFIDLGPLLCPNGKPRDTVEGTLVREDGMHFSMDGATLVWKWLEPQLRAIAKAHPLSAAD